MRLSHLYGARAGHWLGMLSCTRCPIRPASAATATAITLSSVVNSLLHAREAGVDVGDARVRAPVFILGHWRSGTTHLQYLMSQDPRLASPNTYEVCFPWSLLRSEATHGRLLGRLLPGTRLQDRMAFGMQVPNEDEIALAAMGLPTPYLYWAFPHREETWLRYLSFRQATEAERSAFCRGHDAYLRRLAYKHGKTLLLKSPPHTARMRLLADMYPDARFVHITRHPHDVFRSTRHLWDTYHRNVAFLAEPDPSGTSERILRIHEMLYDAFFDDLPHISPERYHHLRYEELTADPVGQLARVYHALDLGPLPEERIRRYLASLSGYRRNRYPALSPGTAHLVNRRWRRSFLAFGYRTAG